MEIYDPSTGWRRYDATPTIATEEAVSILRVSRDTLVSVYDYLDLQWYAHVAGYTGEAQYALLSRTLAYRDQAAGAAGAALCLWLLGLAGRSAWRRYRESDEDRLLRRLSRGSGGFALDRLSTLHPELAAETRRAIYGSPSALDRPIRELDRAWREVFSPR